MGAVVAINNRNGPTSDFVVINSSLLGLLPHRHIH